MALGSPSHGGEPSAACDDHGLLAPPRAISSAFAITAPIQPKATTCRPTGEAQRRFHLSSDLGLARSASRRGDTTLDNPDATEWSVDTPPTATFAPSRSACCGRSRSAWSSLSSSQCALIILPFAGILRWSVVLAVLALKPLNRRLRPARRQSLVARLIAS